MDIDIRPRCDDGSLPNDPNFSLNKWHRLLTEAYEETGRSIEYDEATPQLLRSLGFVDVEDYIVRLPLSGQWPRSKDERKLARWYNSCLVGDSNRDVKSGLESMSLAAFTRLHGYTLEEWREFEKEIGYDIEHAGAHVYHNL